MNLLYPYGKENAKKMSEDACRHLAVEELVDMAGTTAQEKELLRNALVYLPGDEETILYRQEILRDLMDNEELCTRLEEVLKNLDLLNEFRMHSHFTTKKRASLWDLLDYMEEMEIYIRIVEALQDFFKTHEVHSKGLREMAELLKDVADTDRIGELKEIVKGLRAEVSTLKSVLVGINLTPELRPEEIVVMEFGTVPYPSKFSKVNWGASIASQQVIRYREPSQFMKYVGDDMEKELSKNVKNYKSALKSYINFKGYFLLDICNDLRLYLLMAKFGRRLKEQGYALCFPAIRKEAEGVTVKGIYNLRLVKEPKEVIVKNDFAFLPKEKVFILTGPNRGGKTMLTQALGLAALLAAGGWFVTADAYEGFAFTDILTHFPADENETLDLGRLGEEAVRIQKIVKEAAPRTLVLLNETYSSTSAQDGLYLAKDLIHILKHKGIPTVFNTHIHELARSTEEMCKWEGESDVVSLTMEIRDNVNTYRVLRNQPDSSSFARNIALKYGVTYEQLLEC